MRISLRSTYRLIERGEIVAYRFGDSLRVAASDLAAYIAEHVTGLEKADLADAVLLAKGKERTYENYRDALDDVEEVETILVAHHLTGRVVKAASPNSTAVDVEGIIVEELNRVRDSNGNLPTAVAQAGMSGVGDRARRLLKEKGITTFDAATYRTAVRQALADLMNPQRRT